MTEMTQIAATGKRKEAAARVRITEGTGKVIVNGRDGDEYFRRPVLLMLLRQPLELVEMADRIDITASVKGGGLSGQAGAIRHGLARALVEMDATLRTALKRGGFMTRDSRTKERKKYGQPGARKRYQYSKR
ncbi:MAG: 30S ribosomal protein S9 [Pseudomonadota bacterium]